MNFSPQQIAHILAESSIHDDTTADNNNLTDVKLLTPAAVLVPLIVREVGQSYGYHVLLTRRAKHLKHHAGQISFPGGRQENRDIDLKDTALRETYEEIGITPNNVKVIGELPQHQTITRYLMTPYVGIINDSYQLTIDPSEVDEAFEVPLSFICNPDNQKLQSAIFQGEKRYYYSIQYHNYNIWGATARVLVEFSKQLNRFSNTFDHS
ncbi:NUDIX hydrolase [Pleionea mediterranea]|jgi:8-oxo-dGTP pyrophosphatase MutT (NUDIX family)|uniref:8-oxo-dGTP pyrophosphatase MutT (NUDIX family) n=1 Tax=Pleionea mediterranea TaxID=523701 RepID=A0A316FM46_9GAMM|nr:CoA pyrophosphatase [Pleionea mediterranea]PWK49951.1 8-oxo-dGTP pyrophosphatase MutT (NUDIX family) [Pleionea mediterranea]